MWLVWGTGEGYTGFWWGDLREDLDVDGRIILNGLSGMGGIN